MNYKKKSLILSIFLIIIIQILLLINNRQKTSFRYFIWNIQDISIGRLIIISFVSGLLMNTLLSKTGINNIHTTSYKNNDLIDREDINEPDEITPERDLRDPQPTISVNYRVVKTRGDHELIDRDQTIGNPNYKDDWNNNNSEW